MDNVHDLICSEEERKIEAEKSLKKKKDDLFSGWIVGDWLRGGAAPVQGKGSLARGRDPDGDGDYGVKGVFKEGDMRAPGKLVLHIKR